MKRRLDKSTYALDPIPPSPVSERVRSRIDAVVAGVDRRLSEQLDAILHHRPARHGAGVSSRG